MEIFPFSSNLGIPFINLQGSITFFLGFQVFLPLDLPLHVFYHCPFQGNLFYSDCLKVISVSGFQQFFHRVPVFVLFCFSIYPAWHSQSFVNVYAFFFHPFWITLNHYLFNYYRIMGSAPFTFSSLLVFPITYMLDHLAMFCIFLTLLS